MKKSTDKTSAHAQSYNLRAKVHQYQTIHLQTWPNVTTNRNMPKTPKILKTKKIANRFFKNKKWTNQIHAVSPLNYEYF